VTSFGTTLVWLLIAVMAMVTLVLRVSFIGLMGRVDRVPDPLQRALRFVPSAVLAALVVPALIRPDGALDVALGNHRMLAGAVAALVAWRTESVIGTIGAGMGALWLLDWLL
jgi:branched-subunit amino acid transport protein